MQLSVESVEKPLSILASIITLVGFFVWIITSYFGASSLDKGEQLIISESILNYKNLIRNFCFFIFTSVGGALLVKYLSQKFKGDGLFIFSIAIAGTTNFLSIVNIHLYPHKEISPVIFSEAHSLFLFSSLLIYGICFSNNIIKSLESEVKDCSSALSALFGIIITIVIWYSGVSYLQHQLTKTFLPTYPHGESQLLHKDANIQKNER